MSVFYFQELLMIHFLFVAVIPLPAKIRIMTATAAVTVLCPIKVPGGKGEVSSLQPERSVSSRITLVRSRWCHLLSLERTSLLRQESWDENQTSEVLRTLRTEVPCSRAGLTQTSVWKNVHWVTGCMIKISENEFGYHLLLLFSHSSFSTLNSFVYFVFFPSRALS